MKRLLIVTTVPETIEAFLLPFAHHFRTLGWQVDAMAQGVSNSQACLSCFDRVWDVTWSRNPLAPWNLARAPLQIKNAIREQKYDIIHVHTPVAAFVTRFALKGLRLGDGGKLVYTAHGFHFHPNGTYLKNAIFIALERIASKWTDAIVVINHEDQEAAIQHRLLPSDQVIFMPGIGVDIDMLNEPSLQDSHSIYDEMALPSDAKLFLMVAEFIPRKQHHVALQALAQLKRSNVFLAFAGTGPREDEMRALAEALGIGERVRFLGFRRDIPALMRASEATLLPSLQEGLPRSIMESLCLGVPAIGSDIRGIRDLLEGGSGVLVPPGKPSVLADALGWVLDHPEEARQMGVQGRTKMREYDIMCILKKHEILYSDLMGPSFSLDECVGDYESGSI